MTDMINDPVDWMDDDSISFDDADARFQALNPQPTLTSHLPPFAAEVHAVPTRGGQFHQRPQTTIGPRIVIDPVAVGA